MKVYPNSLKGNFSLRSYQKISILIAQSIGFSFLFLGLALSLDFHYAQQNKDEVNQKEYRIITKKVSALNTISSVLGKKKNRHFSPQEIQNLKKQHWCKSLASFSSSDFQVWASTGEELTGQKLSSLLFFESLPEDFIDIPKQDFAFHPEKPIIPILLPKDYLSLYNFGFAPTMGLPQINEQIIQQILINFTLYSDEGKMLQLKGRVVGFSERLNTIVVPNTFMQWSREQLQIKTEPSPPARIILEIDEEKSLEASQFLQDRNYEIAGKTDKMDQLNYIFSLTSLLIIGLGIFISALVISIIFLSLFLLIQKDNNFIRTLFLIGYTPQMLSKRYFQLILPIKLIAWGIALLSTLFVRSVYLPYIKRLSDISWTSFFLFLLFSSIILIFILALDYCFLQQKIKRIYR